MNTKEHFKKMLVTLGWSLTGATICTMAFGLCKFVWGVI